MLYYHTHRKVYQNRRQLKSIIGPVMYNREIKNGNIVFLNREDDEKK